MADRLLYATPTGRHPRMGYMVSLRGIELTCRSFERGPADFIAAVGPVQMARSQICAKAVEDNYDYVVMHDDDLMVSPLGQCGNPLDAWHEVMAMHPKVGMIGAVYLGEHADMPMAVITHPEYPASEGLPEEVCHLAGGLPYAPTVVAGVGTGFVMIRVAALRALREAEAVTGGGPPFKFQVRPNRFGAMVEVGEDYDFCQRLRAVGWDVVADPRFDTIHIKETGTLNYNWHDHESRFKGDAMQVELDRIGRISQAGCRAMKIGDFICIDHTPNRKRDGEAVQAAVAKAIERKAKAA